MPDPESTTRCQPLTEIEDFLNAYSPEVQQIVRQLRLLVMESAPGALEQFDPAARLIGYGFTATYKDTICVIIPLRNGVNFGLPRGALMPDPKGLLTGSGKRARHVRIADAAQADWPALQDLVALSVELIRGQG